MDPAMELGDHCYGKRAIRPAKAVCAPGGHRVPDLSIDLGRWWRSW
jgi:hypothetical protein